MPQPPVTADHPPATTRQRVLLVAILAFALAVRLAYVALAPMPPLRYDALGYDATAKRLIAEHYYAYGSSGELTKRPNAVVMPGYPVFLAAVYEADNHLFNGGGHLTAARLAQALLGAGLVLLVYLVGRRVAGASAGLVGALLAAAYPPAIATVGALWTEALFAFVLMGMLLLVLRATEKPTWQRFALAGAALAIAAYVRPPAVLWAPFAAAYVLASLGWRRGIEYAAIAFAAACLVLAPWWTRNALVYDRFVPLNTLTARPLLETSVPAERTGPVPNQVTWPPALLNDEFALNSYWTRTAMANDAAWLRRDARDFVSLRVERAVRQVREPYLPFAEPIPDWLVGASRSWHALLLLFGAVGLIVLRRQRTAWLLASVPAYTFAFYALTFPDRRYMYTVTPVLAVFAGAALVALAARVAADVRAPAAGEATARGGAPLTWPH